MKKEEMTELVKLKNKLSDEQKRSFAFSLLEECLHKLECVNPDFCLSQKAKDDRFVDKETENLLFQQTTNKPRKDYKQPTNLGKKSLLRLFSAENGGRK